VDTRAVNAGCAQLNRNLDVFMHGREKSAADTSIKSQNRSRRLSDPSTTEAKDPLDERSTLLFNLRDRMADISVPHVSAECEQDDLQDNGRVSESPSMVQMLMKEQGNFAP
jgi:hypothetical protein